MIAGIIGIGIGIAFAIVIAIVIGLAQAAEADCDTDSDADLFSVAPAVCILMALLACIIHEENQRKSSTIRTLSS